MLLHCTVLCFLKLRYWKFSFHWKWNYFSVCSKMILRAKLCESVTCEHSDQERRCSALRVWSSVCFWYAPTVCQWEDGPGSSQQGITKTLLAHGQFVAQQDLNWATELLSRWCNCKESCLFQAHASFHSSPVGLRTFLLSHSSGSLRSLWAVALPFSVLTLALACLLWEGAFPHLLQVIPYWTRQVPV